MESTANNNGSKTTERRRSILAAAAKVFADKGYQAATVDEVASEAGISKGSIYNYFPSKQEMFAQLFRDSMDADERQTDELISQDIPAIEKLSRLLDLWFERYDEQENLCKLVLEYWGTAIREPEPGPFVTALRDVYTRYCKRLATIFTQGHEAGEFTLRLAPEMGAQLLIALVDGIGLQRRLGFAGGMTNDYRIAVKDAIFGSLGVELDEEDVQGVNKS